MRALVFLAALLCCGTLLTSPSVASTPSTVEGVYQPVDEVRSGSTNPSGFDPYIGQGDLRTKAVPVAGCYLWHYRCEEVPFGVQCNPNNVYCKCNGTGLCVNMPPG